MCKTEKGMAGKGRAGQSCARQERGWQGRAGPDREGRAGLGKECMAGYTEGGSEQTRERIFKFYFADFFSVCRALPKNAD
jgi:hypothetical protein